MADINKNRAPDCTPDLSCRRGKVGGEAVLEGIMMKAGGRYSVALRRPDGKIRITDHKYTSLRDKHKILRIPVLRGVVNMVESLILSYRVLGTSADAYALEEEEPTRFEKWLERTCGKSVMDVIMVIAGVLGMVLGFALFFYLPMLVTKGVDSLIGGSLGWFKNVLEGCLRIGIFVLYIFAVSFMNDIRRTFQYHGAEHKTIFCYERGLDLTVENVRQQSRFHPRCGTSFIFVVLIVSVIFASFITWDSLWMRLLIKLPMLPLVVGLSFEFIMYAGKHDNLFTKILSAPGLLMQRMTTKEPDDGQIEIAIAAVKDALHDEFPEFETYQPEGEDYRIVGAAPASDAAEAPADADERESSVQGAAE
ncbi:MAG: DUF1385 domain-containing protein [Clostridia bacterium]|nr:DUF1385 domain-containing protein [Clostridia bacterium]